MSKAVSRNFAFIAVSNVLAPMFSLVLVLAISRLQGVEALGKYSLLMSVFVFGMSVSGFGLPVVITREVARDHAVAGRWFVNASALSVGLLLPIVLVAAVACLLGNADPEMGLALGLTAMSVLPSAITQQAESVLLAFERAQDFVVINLGETALRAVFGTVLVLSGFGVVAIATLLLVLRVGAALAFTLSLRRRGVRLSPHVDARLLRQLVGYVPVTGLIPVVNALYARADIFVLSSLGSWRDVGIYSAALRLVDLARTIPPAYARAIYPVLARMRARGRGEYAEAASRATRNGLLLAIPLALGLSGLAEPAIRILFGSELAPAAAILAGLAWIVVPFSLAIVLAQILFAADRQAVDLGVNLISMAVSLGGAVLLVPRFGAAGAAGSALAGASAYAVLQSAGVARWVTTPVAAGDLARLTLAAVLAVLVLRWCSAAGDVAATALSLATFGGLSLAFGLVPVPATLGRFGWRNVTRAGRGAASAVRAGGRRPQ
jgi:O-antigen/teichoic acid export membrane protein